MKRFRYILLFEVIYCCSLVYGEWIGLEENKQSIPPGIQSRLCGSETHVDSEDTDIIDFNVTAEYSLEGQGAHRVLRYKLLLTTGGDLARAGTEHFQSFAVVHHLSSLIFIDPYDTKRLITRFDTKHVRSEIVGDVDLESIGPLAHPKGVTHLLVVDDIRNLCGRAHGSLQACDIDVGVKVHFRYPLVSRSDANFWSSPLAWILGDKSPVELESFNVYTWGLRQIDANRRKQLCVANTFSLVNLNILGQRRMETDLPAGAERHTEFVMLVTVTTLILSCIRIISI